MNFNDILKSPALRKMFEDNIKRSILDSLGMRDDAHVRRTLLTRKRRQRFTVDEFVDLGGEA